MVLVTSLNSSSGNGISKTHITIVATNSTTATVVCAQHCTICTRKTTSHPHVYVQFVHNTFSHSLIFACVHCTNHFSIQLNELNACVSVSEFVLCIALMKLYGTQHWLDLLFIYADKRSNKLDKFAFASVC